MYETWSLQDAKREIAKAIDSAAGAQGYDENRQVVEKKNHWQDGKGWVGPGRDLPEPIQEKVLASVRPQFSPIDVTNEALDRYRNGLMQREADLTFEAIEPAEEGTSIGEAQAAEIAALRADAAAFWDRVGFWQLAGQALIRSRYAGRGALRIWVAPGSLVEGEGGTPALPQFATLREALEHVQLEAPLAHECYVHTDPETRRKCAIVLFQRDGKELAELWYLDPETGDTVRRVVGDGAHPDEDLRIDLGGRLPVFEMHADVLITEPVRALQRKLNYENSMHLRSSETAGFPERYVANAEPDGDWLPFPPENGAADGTMEKNGETYYLHAVPRTLGASIVTELRGIEGAEGKLVTPTVTFREPTDPKFLAEAATHTRAAALRTCHQGHAATDGTAEASGTAYQQARADFEADLGNGKGPLERLTRETVEGAIALGQAMVARPAPSEEPEGTVGDILTRYRCQATCHVNAGPVTPDERRVLMEQHEKGVLALEDMLAQMGVEDVAAAMVRLQNDPVARARRIKILAEAMDALVGIPGVSAEGAARVVGFTPEEAQGLTRRDSEDGITL